MIKNNALSPFTRPFILNHFLSFFNHYALLHLPFYSKSPYPSLSLSLNFCFLLVYTLWSTRSRASLGRCCCRCQRAHRTRAEENLGLGFVLSCANLDFIALNLSVWREKKYEKRLKGKIVSLSLCLERKKNMKNG
jgi:hypothetical protein